MEYKSLVRDMLIIEKWCIQLVNLTDDFWTVWSRLSTKSNIIEPLIEYSRYGLFDTTLDVKEQTYVIQFSSTVRQITLPVENDKTGAAVIRLVMLTNNFPDHKVYRIPRHANVSQQIKIELQEKRDEVFSILSSIRNILNIYSKLYKKFVSIP